MATQTSMLHVRVDDETEAKAAEALSGLGLSVSDAVRLFLRRVVADQGFPLELRTPNAVTRAAMAEAEDMALNRAAGFPSSDALLADLEKTSGQ